MITKIEGTQWVINDEIMLYENPDYDSNFFVTKNDEYVFENINELTLAITDVKDVFVSTFGFTEIPLRELMIIYCRDCPVTMRPERTQIGLNRIDNVYTQDVYQFSHELMHSALNGAIPDNYLWFEETLCTLSSLLVMDMLYLKYCIKDPFRSYSIKQYSLWNCIPKDTINNLERNFYLYYFYKLRDQKVYHINRDFEKSFSLFLEPIIRTHDMKMCLFSEIRIGETNNFEDFLDEWRKSLTETDKPIADMIKSLFTKKF